MSLQVFEAEFHELLATIPEALSCLAESGDHPPVEATDAARHALEHPLDFPALRQAVIPGDRITLAVDPNIPDLLSLLRGVFQILESLHPGGVTVLLSEEASDQTVEWLRQNLPQDAEIARHAADQRESLSYLAANESGDPLYLHRALVQADFVLPIVVARPAGRLDPAWNAGGLSPAFADVTSRRRFGYDRHHGRSGADAEASSVTWLLGVQMLFVAVPNRQGELQRVLAGTPVGITTELSTTEQFVAAEGSIGDDITNNDLVVAVITGDQQQQSWQNVARGLHAARRRLRPGGTVAVISQVSTPARGSLGWLKTQQTSNEQQIRKELSKQQDQYSHAAATLLDAQQEGRVLLLSRLTDDEVEQLGFGVIDSVAGLKRLIQQHDQVCVLSAAQFSD